MDTHKFTFLHVCTVTVYTRVQGGMQCTVYFLSSNFFSATPKGVFLGGLPELVGIEVLVLRQGQHEAAGAHSR